MAELTITSIPSDLLCCIFANIHTQPLVHAVSLVCKKWRTCALSSVTNVGDVHFLRDADMDEKCRAWRLFPRIKSLSFVETDQTRPALLKPDEFAIPPTWQLKHLSLSGHTVERHRLFQAVLLQSQEWLTTLELSYFLGPQISIYLPSLTTLSIWGSYVPSSHVSLLLALHMTQLVELSIQGLRLGDGEDYLPPNASFPRLQVLKLPSNDFLKTRLLSLVSPSSLKLVMDWQRDFEMANRYVSSITELSCVSMNPYWPQLLEQCTKLQSLQLFYWVECNNDLAFASRIKSLSIRETPRYFDKWPYLTQLTRLICSRKVALPEMLNFPHLDTLVLFQSIGIYKNLQRSIEAGMLPRLRHLHVLIVQVESDEQLSMQEHLGFLLGLLMSAVANGVEELRISLSSDELREGLRKWHTHRRYIALHVDRSSQPDY